VGLTSTANPKKALALGIAAGVVPMGYARAGLKVHAVDINKKLLDVTKEYLEFHPELMTIAIEDARTAARSCETDNDIVAVDLFREDGIPEHLVTREFFADLEHCMKDGGILVMNSFLSVRHMASQHALLKTIASVFGEVVFLHVPPESDEMPTSGFIVARKGGPVGALHPSLENIPERTLDDFKAALATVEIIRPGDAAVADAPVLTDLSNQWKRLALPLEISYRQHIVAQMPWQILLN
jgi:spermidine synthase